MPLPDDLNHLEGYLIENETGPLSFFNRFKRFGPSHKNCAIHVINENPDLVFISCFAFCYIEDTIALAREIKKLNPGCSIIVGGSGVTVYPKYFIQKKCIDFALTGEIEDTLSRFLFELGKNSPDFHKIPGLWYISENFPHNSKIPDAPKKIIPILSFTGISRNRSFYSLSLSRGCPKKCRFCSNRLVHSESFRKCNINELYDSLKVIHESIKGGSLHLNFEDDNILLDIDFFFRVCDMIRKAYGPFTFSMENGIDYQYLSPDLVIRLHEAGMIRFNLSLGTVYNELARQENRYLNVKHYDTVLEQIHRLGIPAVTYFIYGLLNETRESILKNLCFLATRPTQCGISMFYPVPGIQGFSGSHITKNSSPILSMGSAAWPWNKSCSTEILITVFRLSRYINLLKADSQDHDIQNLLSLIAEKKSLHTILKREKEIIEIENQDRELVGKFLASNKVY